MVGSFEDMLKTLAEHVKSVGSSETVVGAQFTLGEFSCVPVIRLGLGFGAGGGSGEDSKKGKGDGGGGGAGIGVEPLGFLVTRGDDIQFLSVGKRSGLAAAMEKMPELLQQMLPGKKSPAKEDAPAET